MKGWQLYASLTPFLISHLEEDKCIKCLSYEVIIEGEPILKFEGVPIDTPYVESQVTRKEGLLDVSLKLVPNKEFYDSYTQLSLLGSLIISFTIASIFTALLYKLITIRQSFHHVLNEAINKAEFVPYYQPIVDSRTSEVIGAEVLVRWIKPDGKIIPPYQFIPYAEDSGLIVPITDQLIEKVIQDIVKLGWSGGTQFMSINIVPVHLTNDELFNLVKALCEKHHIVPSTLSLEITERQKIPDLSLAKATLNRFYEYGINLKLDDAGTGYGGFSYVQELGILTLKIDKMFIDTIETDDVKNSVLDAIISFIETSNLDAIAEGVENQKQVEYLKQRGIYKIQGYVYGKPMPIEDLEVYPK
ncbi:EAL domain-containing protein [Shewanella sp. D64]|uniref:EAL domain-containing protein n=1 Tax=unclassified Shewanella TaxID=196818 RepID=UPI0022BA207D|nr:MULTISPECIES: EAL domain-containing protein [unclassified Shewanella]MEC4728927.1 EAL domain-containing protein [Shewanella sp. D64]MEC4740874.1 EAL domain-containing protein [Shewanella sp. E94]WBJ96701.1 EAL domain-containing protein [Shewanella sp. MTB7]